ncbi:MAG: ABC transporter permease [Chloroflexi bacterium]|nr:ABC transporter permease [Chloroflexota bacterium]
MNIQLVLAARYLWGRKLRTTLTTLAVVFGVMILFGMNSMLPIMSEALRKNILVSVGQVDLTVTHETGGSFDPAAADIVRGTPGVAQATGLLRRNVLLPPSLSPTTDPRQAVSAVTVTGLDPVDALKVRAFQIGAGRFLEPGDGNALVVPQSLADKLGLAVGDTLTLPSSVGTADFQVVGILNARFTLGVDEVYVSLAAAQKLLNQPGEINTVEALFAAGADRAQVEADVLARLGPAYQIGQAEAGAEMLAVLNVAEIIFDVFGLLALAMSGFIILNTFRTVVAERRRDLGMLRAVGASRRTILGLILTESLVQGVAGTAIGMTFGFLLASLLTLLIGPLMQQYIRVEIGPQLPTLANVVSSIVLGVGLTVAGGFFPALAAGRVTPLDALRPAVGRVAEQAASRWAIVGAALIVLATVGLLSGNLGLAALGTLLFLTGLVLIAPALIKPIANTFGRLLGLILAREGQIAQGNLVREPGRAAITASAMMIGLAITVALFGEITSISAIWTEFLDTSLGADYLVMPHSLVLGGGNLGASAELAQQIGQTPGVAGVTTLRLGTAMTKGASLQVIGVDPATFPTLSGLSFSSVGDPAEAYAALGRERAIITNGIFAAQNQVQVGDVLTLKTPEGDQDYFVVGIGMDYLNAKLATAYISQANLATDFHQSSDMLIMANATPDADKVAVRAALQRIVQGYPAFTLLDSAAFRETQLQTFNAMIPMLYALAFILAVPGLIAMINTLAINVVERTREIGMLRAVGSTRRQIQKMILGESLLLAATGVSFGILAGIWLGYVMAGAMTAAGFELPYHFPWAGILAVTAVGLLCGVLAALLPARQAAQLDIVTALHYE